MKAVIGIALLLVSFGAFADFNPNWTREDSLRQAAATTLFVADWYQTRYFIKHPCLDGTQTCARPLFENGPARHIIGRHPSVGELNTFTVLGIGAHAAISYMLPPEWRHAWQYVFIGYEAYNVHRTYVGFRSGGL